MMHQLIIGVLLAIGALAPPLIEAVGPQITISRLAQCEVTWDAPVPMPPNLAGYRLYIRKDPAAYNYTTPSGVPGPKDTSRLCTAAGVTAIGQYFVVLRAVDTAGKETQNSNEAPFEVIADPPPALPAPTGLAVRERPQ